MMKPLTRLGSESRRQGRVAFNRGRSDPLNSAINVLKPCAQGRSKGVQLLFRALLSALTGVAILELIELESGMSIFTVVQVKYGSTSLKAVQNYAHVNSSFRSGAAVEIANRVVVRATSEDEDGSMSRRLVLNPQHWHKFRVRAATGERVTLRATQLKAQRTSFRYHEADKLASIR